MKIENIHIDYIKQAFASMKSSTDFLKLMNYAKNILYGEKTFPFMLGNINYYLRLRSKETEVRDGQKSKIDLLADLLEENGVKVYRRTAYKKFSIQKKTGGMRVIHAPRNGLKEIQKCLNIILQAIFTPHEAATGFVNGKSIVDNASIHCKQNYVYNIDLKDFFSSIDQARFWKRLQYPPFNLTPHINDTEFARIFLLKGLLAAEKTKAGRYNIANIIASLCFTEMEVERKNEKGEWIKVKRNVLPQGAPTSPTVTNIICERLDRRLSGLAKRFGLKYTRYADDITFSSMHFEYSNDGEFIKELNRIITEQNFDIKESKTRLQKQGYKQEVTGLVVNQKANVNAQYIKELRMWIYLWEKYGYEKAYNYFLPKYKAEKGHSKKGKPDMVNVIGGKLDYLKMVKGADNELYLKLKNRFDILVGYTNPINQVLSIWENDGINKAMDVYYKDKLD